MERPNNWDDLNLEISFPSTFTRYPVAQITERKKRFGFYYGPKGNLHLGEFSIRDCNWVVPDENAMTPDSVRALAKSLLFHARGRTIEEVLHNFRCRDWGISKSEKECNVRYYPRDSSEEQNIARMCLIVDLAPRQISDRYLAVVLKKVLDGKLYHGDVHWNAIDTYEPGVLSDWREGPGTPHHVRMVMIDNAYSAQRPEMLKVMQVEWHNALLKANKRLGAVQSTQFLCRLLNNHAVECEDGLDVIIATYRKGQTLPAKGCDPQLAYVAVDRYMTNPHKCDECHAAELIHGECHIHGGGDPNPTRDERDWIARTQARVAACTNMKQKKTKPTQALRRAPSVRISNEVYEAPPAVHRPAYNPEWLAANAPSAPPAPK